MNKGNVQKQKQNKKQQHQPLALKTPQPRNDPAHPLLALQQKVGNAQIARAFEEQREETPIAPVVGKAGGPISNRLASEIYRRLGRGEPLAHARRAELEATFGKRLESVRLHTGADADVLSRSLGARAFTLGRDIFFSNQASPEDRELLTHEVTHVIQQREMTPGGQLSVGPAENALEHAADAVATSATAHQSSYADAGSASAPAVQRSWLEDAYNFASNTAGSIGLGTSAIMESARGTQAAGVSRAGDFLARGAGSGVQSVNNLLAPLGLITGTIGTVQGVDQAINAPTRGGQIQGGTDALFNAMGAFSGGVGTASLLGASVGSLGPAAAVAGAGAGGYALGTLIDQGFGAAGRAITGNSQEDYTLSGLAASGMTAIDQSVSSLWADPNEPAYTQTLGWKLGEWLGI